MSFPESYRDAFVNYLSSDRVQNPDQFITLYANDIAMKGPGDDGELADGAIIVGEVYAVKKDDDGSVIETRLGRRIATKLTLVAVMETRNGWAETSASSVDVGDWDFAAFTPTGNDAGKALDSCRSCHAPLTETDVLFSIEHLPSGRE